MCLIALAWNVHPRYPLAMIANRDELHSRPSAPAGRDPDHHDVFGGRDQVQGGGWLMVSSRGRMAAVTNVRVGLNPETAPLSRGALVRGFVSGNVSAASYLDGLAADALRYGRFNLLAWDGTSLAFATNDPSFATRVLEPGIHAMSNGALDATWPKGTHATQALSEWLLKNPDEATNTADLFEALADTTHAPDSLLPDTGVGIELERALSPPFLRGETYGTRCSTIVLVAANEIAFLERRFAPNAVPAGESAVLLSRA
ncbi:MAG: NRDE family protein [Gammaproteobacteria bacterium]|nr:NRDE family protein [Gammaproteobacteria bacterium]